VSHGFYGEPPGELEVSVDVIMDTAWNASPLANSHESGEPLDYADFAGAVTSMLVVIQDAIEQLASEVDSLRAQLAALEK
jgi:hypothetical protein